MCMDWHQHSQISQRATTSLWRFQAQEKLINSQHEAIKVQCPCRDIYILLFFSCWLRVYIHGQVTFCVHGLRSLDQWFCVSCFHLKVRTPKPGNSSLSVLVHGLNRSGVVELVGREPLIIARVENGVTKFSPQRQKTPKLSKKIWIRKTAVSYTHLTLPTKRIV